MAINFPDNPSNGDTHQGYTYNSTKGTWTPASSPAAVVEYATADLLPGTADAGDMAFVTATNRLYIWNGSGWYNIALINTNPTMSGVSSSYALAMDGTPTTVTITATDPEGIPITYSIASDTSGNIATVSQGTGASSNVFTITPSTNTAHAGTFSLTFRASDGVNIASTISSFTLVFIVSNSNYTTALITTGGSAGTNSTFTDSSTNSLTVTANGNVHQTSFSPSRSGGYSLFCDGTGGDYIKTDTSADFAFGSNDFTVECWYYPVSKAQNYPRILHFGEYWSNSNAWALLDRHNSSNTKFTVQSFAFSPHTILESTTTVSNNQWYHLAVVRNGSTITLYVDGVAEDTYNISTNNYPDASSTNYLSLLNVSNGSNLSEAQANGYLRDVRVVKGTAIYTSAFTPTTESLTAVSNTKFLLGSAPYIFDSSTSAHTFTRSTGADYSTKPFGPYDYQEYTAGDHGGSTYFDGTGDYLSIPAGDWKTFGTDNFTMEMWFNTPNTSSQYLFSDINSGGSNNTSTVLLLLNSGVPACYIQDTTYNLINGSTTIRPNQWHHIAVVRDGATITLYLDGKSEATYNIGTAAMNTSTEPGWLGKMAWSGSYDYTGYISDFRVVKGTALYTANFTPPVGAFTAVTNTSLLVGMQGAKIFDKSQSATNLTLVGDTTASTAQYKYLPTSMYFDGTGDYITSNIVGLQSDWTVEFWAYCTSAGTQQSMVTFNAGSFNGMNIWRNTSNQLVVDDGQNAQSAFTGATLSTNTWEHIAIVRSGTTTTGYINGSSVGSHSFTPAAINAISIGRYNGSPYFYYNGYLSDVRATSGLARYTANFTPPTAALQG